MNNWKKAGLIGLGALLGVLLSLNFSVIAQREAKLPIPYEDLQLLSAVFGRIKSDYVEPVSDDKLIKEAINGMVHGLDPHSDFLDADAFKDLQISTQGNRRPHHRGGIRRLRPRRQRSGPPRSARHQAGDLSSRSTTATRGCRCKAVEDARQARHPGRAHRRAQGVDAPLTSR
jgi:hypothetical protein